MALGKTYTCLIKSSFLPDLLDNVLAFFFYERYSKIVHVCYTLNMCRFAQMGQREDFAIEFVVL